LERPQIPAAIKSVVLNPMRNQVEMLMTDDTTMVESSNPASHFRLALHKKKAKKSKESEKVIKVAIELTFHYLMRILMTPITLVKKLQKNLRTIQFQRQKCSC